VKRCCANAASGRRVGSLVRVAATALRRRRAALQKSREAQKSRGAAGRLYYSLPRFARLLGAVMLDETDRAQLAELGIAEDEVARQVGLFAHPPHPAALVRPCTVGAGIELLEGEGRRKAQQAYRGAAQNGRLLKFVPASGAATRMFQSLLAVRQREGETARAGLEARAAAGDGDSREALTFLDNLSRFPFVGALADAVAKRGASLDELIHQLVAKPLDVQRAAGCEMQQRLFALCGAVQAGRATRDRLVLDALDARAADRADLRQVIGPRPRRPARARGPVPIGPDNRRWCRRIPSWHRDPGAPRPGSSPDLQRPRPS